MQNVVTVASLSPPNVMTSTKPAAQAATAPIQDSFELVLQKTSEQLDQKSCENASPGSEDGPNEIQKSQNSSTSSSVSETQDRNEVKKPENSTEEEVVEEKNTEDHQTKEMIEQNVVPFVETTMHQQQDVLTAEIPVEVIEDAEGVSSTAVVTALDDHASTDSQASAIEAENGLELPVTPKSTSTVIVDDQEKTIATPVVLQENTVEKSTTPSEPIASATPEENVVPKGESLPIEDGITEQPSNVKVDLQKNTQLSDKDQPKTETKESSTVQVNAEIKQDETTNKKLNSTTVSSTDTGVSVKSTTTTEKVESQTTNSLKDTAPPDTPNVTENVTTTTTVTSTQQLNEPARLAEAPKNEVVAQVVNQIDKMVKTNRSSVRLQLYPEELGHIDLKITTTKNGIGVTMIADSSSTQDALRSDMNNLKQNMQQAGIQLSDLNIGQGQNSNKQQQFEETQKMLNSAYQSVKESGTKSAEAHKQVQLQTTAIDYRI